MIEELAAVRLLAPSFGDSAPVWTNVIAAILLALALGSALGGRLADRGLGPVLLPSFLGIAGAGTFLAPFLVPRISSWLLPPDLPLDQALPLLIKGSLGVSLLVFSPPVLFAGAVPPLLIRLGSREASVGRVSGLVYASGTIGSLSGTFLATHVFVPLLGLSATFGLAGGLLLLAGLFSLTRLRGGFKVFLLLLPPGATLWIPPPRPPWIGPGEKILEVKDSTYQRLWVVEGNDSENSGPYRKLCINEGLDSYQSFHRPGRAFTGGRYYDAFALLPPALGRGPVRALSLGCATGSILRAVAATAGESMEGIGVELDPDVLTLGRRFFGTEELESGGRIRFLGGVDARFYLQQASRKRVLFDLILLDTYRNQIYLPPHLCTREFFLLAKSRLAKRGIFACNVGDLLAGGPVLRAVASTLATVFPTVESLGIPGSRNFLLAGSSGPPGSIARALRRRSRPEGFPSSLWERALRGGAWRLHRPTPSEPVLTDDRAPILLLQERAYMRGRGEG